MSNQSLQDLLGGILDTYGDRFEAAKEGRAPESAWDGPPLPLNLQYRVVVDSSVVKPSNASGKNQFVITYEIQEPAEHAGRKVQAYYAQNPPNEFGKQALADLFGALRADMTGWGEDIDGFAAQFVGRTAVVALQLWGTDNDRYGIRYINADRGQTLKTDVQPKKSSGGAKSNDLKADIVIPKNPDPQAGEASTPAASTPAAPVSPPLPGGGPNLPPALRG